ncbi:hydrogenase nickel incorporation protein HybF [Maioricimonas rarisocia]|uniref:Hydrogenase maturation factor HypA n=1 Tax=Maioricimonas rarisocia TaxID=2528026 RepID=A0A517Z6P2_9PLAN|nr:hydrogenase maturation nickel metallochaperone HypA [Maioricimonas rarisocia]QDU38109.1 hydrogenase nickel incorporation protein HybF [Maioricimonas rarisocia]
MHEVSLVRSLLNQVERLCEAHGGTAVTDVEVEIGPLSGVEPLLAREAFALLVADFGWPAAELTIEEVPLMAICQSCGAEVTVESFRFECPGCGSRSLKVTRGDQFRLLNVTLETATPMEPAS